MEPVTPAELKPLRTALQAFDRARNWDLGALLNWQDQLLEAVSELPHFDFEGPEKAKLLLRLAQCLNPDQSAVMISFNVLRVYEVILTFKQNSPMPLDESVAMLTASLLGFYESAGIKLKRNVLQLLRVFYLPLEARVLPCLPSLVCALLVTLEEEDQKELLEVASALLEDFCAIDPAAFYQALWTAMLRSPRVKLTALSFLSEHKEAAVQALDLSNRQTLELIVAALLATLQEPDVLIKTQGLSLICAFFPFYDRSIDRSAFHKLLLEVLLTVKEKEYAISKKVRDWFRLTDGADIAELLDLLTPTLLELFESVPNSEAEAQAPVAILWSLMEEEELADSLFEFFGATLLRYTAQYHERCPSVRTDMKRVLEERESRLDLLWRDLAGQLEDHAMNFDLQNTLNLLSFLLELRCVYTGSAPYEVLGLLLASLEDYSERSRGPVLRLIEELLEQVDLDSPSPLCAFESFMATEMESLSAAHLDQCLRLYCLLHSKLHSASSDLWVQGFLVVLQSEDLEKTLIAGDWAAKLCPYESSLKEQVDSVAGSDLAVLVLKRLWTLVPVQCETDRVSALVVRYMDQYPAAKEELLRAWLKHSTESEICCNLDKFVRVWRAGSAKPGQLERLFASGIGIFHALGLLNHPSPSVHMHAKEWLLEALPRLDIVTQGLFVLLEGSEKRKLRALRYLAGMLEACPTDVLRELQAKQEAPRLLAGLLDRLFNLLWGETPSRHSPLQLETCRVLKQVAGCGWAQVCVDLAPRLLRKLLAALRDEDCTVIALELTELLLRILFKSQLYEKSKKLRIILESEDCLSVIASCTENHLPVWLETLPEVIKLLVSLVDPVLLMPTLKRLFPLLIRMATDDEENVASSLLLASSLEVTLELCSPDRFVAKGGQHLLSSYSDLSGLKLHPGLSDLFRTLSHGFHRPKEHRTYSLLQLAFDHLAAALSAFLPLLPSAASNAPASPRFQPLIDVLTHYSLEFPEEVTAVFISLWINLQTQDAQNPELPKGNSQYPKLVQVYLSLGLPWPTVLGAFTRFLGEGLGLKKGVSTDLPRAQELLTCEFLYELAAACQTARNSLEAWHKLLRFSKLLSLSPRPEAKLWAMELLTQPDNRCSFLPLKSNDRRLIRKVQAHVSKISRLAVQYVSSDKRVEMKPPSAQDMDSLRTCSLYTLKKCLVPLIRLGWGHEQEQVAQLRTLTQPIVAFLLGGDSSQPDLLFTELLLAITDSVPAFTSHLSASFIDFIMTEGFWTRMRGKREDFTSWKQLINNIAIHCFPSRDVLVLNIMGRLNVGLFTSKNYENQQHARIIRCLALLLYSGAYDDYQQAQSLLTERILDWLKYNDGLLTPLVFLLVRVMIYKMTAPYISEEWPRIWPHLFMELHRRLTGKQAGQQLAAVKLLELLECLDIEDFRYYSWAFFHTDPNLDPLKLGAPQGYAPLLARLLQSRPPKYFLDSDDLTRTIKVTKTEIRSVDEAQDQLYALLTKVLNNELQAKEPDSRQMEKVLEQDLLALTSG